MADTMSKIHKKEAETPKGVERTMTRRVYVPDVDILETADDIVVTADMPGVDEKSVDIMLEKDLLTIYGRVEAGAPEKYRPVLSEYDIGDYQRSFTLTNEVDRDKIRATVKNGVLKLILPKSATVKKRTIMVTAEA